MSRAKKAKKNDADESYTVDESYPFDPFEPVRRTSTLRLQRIPTSPFTQFVPVAKFDSEQNLDPSKMHDTNTPYPFMPDDTKDDVKKDVTVKTQVPGSSLTYKLKPDNVRLTPNSQFHTSGVGVNYQLPSISTVLHKKGGRKTRRRSRKHKKSHSRHKKLK